MFLRQILFYDLWCFCSFYIEIHFLTPYPLFRGFLDRFFCVFLVLIVVYVFFWDFVVLRHLVRSIDVLVLLFWYFSPLPIHAGRLIVCTSFLFRDADEVLDFKLFLFFRAFFKAVYGFWVWGILFKLTK